jgi:hypothetical protein
VCSACSFGQTLVCPLLFLKRHVSLSKHSSNVTCPSCSLIQGGNFGLGSYGVCTPYSQPKALSGDGLVTLGAPGCLGLSTHLQSMGRQEGQGQTHGVHTPLQHLPASQSILSVSAKSFKLAQIALQRQEPFAACIFSTWSHLLKPISLLGGESRGRVRLEPAQAWPRGSLCNSAG